MRMTKDRESTMAISSMVCNDVQVGARRTNASARLAFFTAAHQSVLGRLLE